MPSLRALRYLTLAAVIAGLAACQPAGKTGNDAIALTPVAGAKQAAKKADVVAIAPQYISDITAIKSVPAVRDAFETIKSYRANNVKTLIELTEIPAPPFGEELRGKRVAELFKEAGLTDVTTDAVGNVIARRPGKTGDKVIAIGAHIDTVFPIETDLTVRKEGNVYYAPGIGDNTQGIVLMLSLIRAMAAHNIETDADILFIGNVGEEGLGDLRGIKHLYREGGPQIDAFIAIDGGSIDRLIYGAVGSYRYRVTYQGRGGHSWGSFGAANPHHALARAIEQFATRAPDVTSSGEKSSFSVGRIGGGTSVNSIAFESWMEVDMRSGDPAKIDAIDAIFKQAVQDGLNAENAARTRGDALTVNVKPVGNRPAGQGSPDAPLVQHAMAAMQAMGITPTPAISSTDANIPISLGKPAITISRGGISKGAHGLDESWEDKDAHVAIQMALLITLAQAAMRRNHAAYGNSSPV